MNNILKLTAAAAFSSMLLNSCIKEATPTSVAIQKQVTLETSIEGIPAALVQAGSTGYDLPWDFGLPAIHIATESMTGDLVVSGNTGYDWFSQWGSNIALGSEYAVGALTWNNYYKWIMAANNVIKLIDTSDFSTLDDTQKKYLGFAYAYRAMFYFDLVRLYEFKKNNYTQDDSVLGLGVPVVLPETTEAQAKNNPRAKVSDIYDKIIFPDLDNAETLLANYKASDKYTISLAVVYEGKGLSGERDSLRRCIRQCQFHQGIHFSSRVRPQGHHCQRMHTSDTEPVGGSGERLQQCILEQFLDVGSRPSKRKRSEPHVLHSPHVFRKCMECIRI